MTSNMKWDHNKDKTIMRRLDNKSPNESLKGIAEDLAKVFNCKRIEVLNRFGLLRQKAITIHYMDQAHKSKKHAAKLFSENESLIKLSKKLKDELVESRTKLNQFEDIPFLSRIFNVYAKTSEQRTKRNILREGLV